MLEWPRKEYRQREQRATKEEGVVLKEEGRRRQHIDGKDRGEHLSLSTMLIS